MTKFFLFILSVSFLFALTIPVQAQNADTPTGLFVKFRVKPGRNAAFEAAFRQMQQSMREKEPGALYYDLFVTPEDPQLYVIMERYRDDAAVAAHGQTEHMSKVLAELRELMDGPPAPQRLVFVSALTDPTIVSASDPIDGTWDLDVAASTFDPGPGRTSDTRTYKVDGDTIRMTGTVVFSDGRTESIQFDAAFDGKDYNPSGNPRAETIAQVRVDTYTSRTTTKRGGVATATSTRQVSKDGKTLKIMTTGTDEKGVAFNNTLVFRKR